MKKSLSRLFNAFWPLGLFAFYVLIILSFTRIPPEMVAQFFGLTILGCAAVAWVVLDYIGSEDKRVLQILSEMEDLLRPYEGVKLRDMPPDVQAEVRRRLGWVDKKKTKAAPTPSAAPSAPLPETKTEPPVSPVEPPPGASSR